VSRQRLLEAAGRRARAVGAFARAHRGGFGWLAYGGFLALLFQGTLRGRAPTTFTCSRLTDLTLAVRAMDMGAPPLLAFRPGGGGGLYPAGYADDVGPFMYLAPLGHVLGITNPYTLYRIEFVALWSIALIVWPLVFSRLFNSRLVGVLAPILLVLLVVEDRTATNQYWIPGWTVAICLPLLMLAVKRGRAGQRGAGTWLLICGAAAIAGFANTMRLGSGYGIAVGALAVAVLLARRWRTRALAAVLAVGAFWVASTGVIDAATAYRNAQYGSRPLAPDFTDAYGGTTVNSLAGAAHPFWHTFYIGLGFDRNQYGISYTDSSADNYVHSVNPAVKLESAEYASILRKRYFRLLSRDPSFVIGTYVHKAGVTLDMAAHDTWYLLVLLPLALLAGWRRRELLAWLALFVPPLLVLLAVPTAVAPLQGYQNGFLNGLRVLFVVLLCWITAEAELALVRTRGNRSSWLTRFRDRYLARYLPLSSRGYVPAHRPRGRRALLAMWHSLRGAAGRLRHAVPRRVVLVTAFVVLVEIAASVGASAVAAHERGEVRFPNAQVPEQKQILTRSGILRWESTSKGLTDWGAVNGATESVNGRAGSRTASIRTVTARYTYQLAGPTVTLPAGTYQLWVNGSAQRAGSILVALDADTDTTIGSRTNQPGTNGTGGWGLIFRLGTSRTVRFVIANNGGTALWRIDSIELGRAPAQVGDTAVRQGCAFAPLPPGVTNAPATSTAPTVGAPLRTWTARQLVRRWIPQSGSRVRLERGTAVVHTSAFPYGYQLASPVLTASGGLTVMEVEASVASGGLEIIAQVPGGHIVAKRAYGSGLPHQGPVSMRLPLRLDTSQGIQFVLANSTPSGSASTTWRITKVVLARGH
jgi:hypothetical protein